MNIDLKAFSAGFYHSVGGNLETVKRSIKLAAQSCHNGGDDALVIQVKMIPDTDMERLAAWLASLDKTIPLHISRFFPSYKMRDKEGRHRLRISCGLREAAPRHLEYVYEGNCR